MQVERKPGPSLLFGRMAPGSDGFGGRTRGQGIFSNFLISYLFVLLIPLIFGVFIYQQSISIITENVKNENLIMLEQARDAFDINLRNAEMALTQISLNPNVVTMMYNQNTDKTDMVYRFKAITNSLASFNYFNDFVTGYFIMFRECNYVIFREAVYPTRSFFDHYFSQAGVTYLDWLDGHYRKNPKMGFYKAWNIVNKGVPRRIYEYSVSIPFTSMQKNLGSISVFIDEENIQKLMERSGTQIFSYIADNRGNMVSFFSDKYTELPAGHTPVRSAEMSGHFIEKAESGKNVIYFTHSPDRNWVFVAAQSQETMLQPINNIRNLFLLVLFAMVLLALIISLLNSWWKARPLSRIMNSLEEYSGISCESAAGGQLGKMRESVMTLISENNAIRAEIERQRPILQNVFLSRLLRGEITGREEIQSNFSRMHVTIEDRRFIVILGSFERVETGREHNLFSGFQAMKAVLTDTMQLGSQEVRFLIVDLDEKTIACIGIALFSNDIEYVRYCREYFSSLRDKLSREYFFSIRFAAGLPVESLTRLYYSYDTALYAHENGLLRGCSGDISVFEPDLRRNSRYDYSLAAEMRLMNFVREGNQEGVKTALSYIFENRNISDTMDNDSLKLFLAAIKNTLFRLNSIMFSGDPEIYRRLDAGILAIEHFDQKDITEAFEALCITMKKKQNNSEPDLKKNLLKFVHDNYRRNDFYLGSLTDHFKLSETWLSLFFKECTGENFISYVEALRLRDACDLLKRNSIPIETIAASVGYSSAHAFRRAFKRRYGMSPTEYRNLKNQGLN
jgi:AraC-like DNA-binding protein